ncbi:MAG: 3-coathanger stack domain-containing protein, partial [Bacteroidota bacterium]
LTLANQTLPTGTYRSQGDLTANMCIVPNGNNVEFKSDTGVLLQAGFTVELGGVLEILIEACQ